MAKLKLLRDCGPKYPKDTVVEDTPEVRAALEGMGYKATEDFDAVAPADELGQAIGDRISKQLESLDIGAQVERAVERAFAPLTDSIKRKVEVVAEPVDKDPKRGYRNLAEFAEDVFIASNPTSMSRDRAESDKRVRLANDAEVAFLKSRGRAITPATEAVIGTSGPTGAYLMPTEFRKKLWLESLEQTVFVQDCMMVDMGNAESVEYPAVDDYDHSGGTTFGGVSVYRPAEGAAVTASRPKFSTIKLAVNAKVIAIPITDKMQRFSAVAMGPLFGQMSAAAMAWNTDNELLFGNGGSTPIGVANSACLVSVARNTASTFLPVDADKMWQAMPQRFRGTAKWIMTVDLEDDMQAWSRVGGTAMQLVYTPPGGIADKPYGTLKGRPVLFSEHCKAPNTVGDVMLVAPSQYAYARSGGIEEAYSMHLLFDYVTGVFRYLLYDDGKPVWKSAFTPQNGSTSQSPFVALAAK